MYDFLGHSANWMKTQGNLFLPLILTLWMALVDVRTHRIPNYLTLATALTGLSYQMAFHGWPGLGDGLLGMALGFAFLILPYVWGGMGAGDVKALAALGTWLGPWRTLFLFVYMGVAGGVIALGVLWWRGLLWQKLCRGWAVLLNLILCRPLRLRPGEKLKEGVNPLLRQETQGIPYGVAIAIGMAAVLGKSKAWP
jgi:prepilin peptidase CpaA